MIKMMEGNLLRADVQALVNTVNTEGVMGKGIALQFKRAFPEVFEKYEADCKAGKVMLGKMHVCDLGGLGGGPEWIINFPTKGHWRAKSKLSDIERGLTDLINVVDKLSIRSIAVPPLGCGHGGLEWAQVRPLIESAFSRMPDVSVLLYAPTGTPEAVDMPNKTKAPTPTIGTAAVIALISKYINGLLATNVRLLEVQKLMYFLQEAGEPLKLEYCQHTYGPYANNLRHVLSRMEGHWIQGFGDGQENPNKEIDLIGAAEQIADEFLEARFDTQDRMERVAELIEGYETPFGLELLSTTHWAMCHDLAARDSKEAAIRAVHSWNDRKRNLMKPQHIEKAWLRLKNLHWDLECRSASH